MQRATFYSFCSFAANLGRNCFCLQLSLMASLTLNVPSLRNKASCQEAITASLACQAYLHV